MNFKTAKPMLGKSFKAGFILMISLSHLMVQSSPGGPDTTTAGGITALFNYFLKIV